MEITIILTSYNRPFFVKRAIESVLAQTSTQWRLIIQEDGSGMSVVDPLRQYAYRYHRITMYEHPMVQNRKTVTRYAVLINEVLPIVTTELVAYMCDNVEYHPDYVSNVIAWFAANPDSFAGYVKHERDWWNPDTCRRIGKASDFNAWDYTPPGLHGAIESPLGLLDHSQVIHRLPVDVAWDEDIKYLKYGDGIFFNRLAQRYGAIEPIHIDTVLSYEHLFG